MKKNVGGYDKIFRISAGLIIIALGIIFQSWWGALGLLPLLTGLANWCPIYVPFDFNTKEFER